MGVSISRRTVITVVVFLTSLVILTTSILMFISRYSNKVATVHTVVGFIFLSFAIWHAVNNYGPLKKYLSPRSLFVLRSKYALSSLVAIVFSTGLLVLAIIEFEPFKAFHQWGTKLRLTDDSAIKGVSSFHYKLLDVGGDSFGRDIKIDFKVGSSFHWPQYAIWVEKLDGSFVQPLFVTGSVATNSFNNKVWLADKSTILKSNPFDNIGFKFESLFSEQYDESANNNKFRPESLPVFLHKINRHGLNGGDSSGGEGVGLDAYTGATVLDNYLMSQKIEDQSTDKYNVFFEINQSFDFNEYYSSDRFPDDEVYSGDGFSAQPSVIYRTQIDFSSPTTLYPMSIVGHGHHSGQDGLIDTNVENMTTALTIVDRIIVDIR